MPKKAAATRAGTGAKEKQKKVVDEEETKSDEKNVAQGGAQTWTWNHQGTLVYGSSSDSRPSTKIAGFDMDHTLLMPKSGAKFPQNAQDWQLWNPQVLPRLRELHAQGYKIVIFSNQGGIAAQKQKESDLTEKIEAFSRHIGIPLQALLASDDDAYRKPGRAMWDHFVEKMNGGVAVDYSSSFYCGDAAGRKGPPKDFSDTDLKFALNIALPFQLPEETILGQKGVSEQLAVGGFDPKTLRSAVGAQDLFEQKGAKATSEKQELIVFCGSPGSGKSTFTQVHLKTYERVNRDTLKTKEKCLKVAEEALKNGKSVVIDNTTPKAEDRVPYIQLAQKYKVPARCFYFAFPKDLCFHLNSQRASNTLRQHLSSKVSSVQIHSWFKNHEKPQTAEGFTEVLTVKFVPGPFESKAEEDLFFSYGK